MMHMREEESANKGREEESANYKIRGTGGRRKAESVNSKVNKREDETANSGGQGGEGIC
jgi:hypothetical protein